MHKVPLDKFLNLCSAHSLSIISPVTSPPSAPLMGVTHDSRRSQLHSIFVALVGAHHNGENYISTAIKQGAQIVVARPETCRELAPQFPNIYFVCASVPRAFFPHIVTLFYPDQPQVIVGVTGTNGKTSVVNFCYQLWTHLGIKAACMGTLGSSFKFNNEANDNASLTTADPLILHQWLDKAAHQNIQHVALEASSHGLDQCRLDGVQFSAAAFTNLSHEHLDYHQTTQKYLEAKLHLFKGLLKPNGVAILNADVPEFHVLKEACRHHTIITYGRRGAELKIVSVEAVPDGMKVSLEILGRSYTLHLSIIGHFQVSNLLCAIGLLLGSGLEEKKITDLMDYLPLLSAPRGRLELAAKHSSGAAIYVDFAHSPDALQTVLEVLRQHTKGRIHLVFGCGGNRDRAKRTPMGEIGDRLADEIIITDDNPRYEDPQKIRAEILQGCPRAGEEGDRRKAIQKAMASLRSEDVLLIAGKGHEEGQKRGDTIFPFNDVQVVQELLNDGQ